MMVAEDTCNGSCLGGTNERALLAARRCMVNLCTANGGPVYFGIGGG